MQLIGSLNLNLNLNEPTVGLGAEGMFVCFLTGYWEYCFSLNLLLCLWQRAEVLPLAWSANTG